VLRDDEVDWWRAESVMMSESQTGYTDFLNTKLMLPDIWCPHLVCVHRIGPTDPKGENKTRVRKLPKKGTARNTMSKDRVSLLRARSLDFHTPKANPGVVRRVRWGHVLPRESYMAVVIYRFSESVY